MGTTVATDFPTFTAFDAEGNPLVGGQLYTYAAGTTTPQATYQDFYGAANNTNPVILDSTGSATVYLGPQMYKFVLLDINGATVWTQDNVFGCSFVSPAMQPVVAASTVAAALALMGGVTMADVIAAVANATNPTGALLDYTGVIAPTGYVAADGSLLLRATYPALWTFAQASGNIAADDATWTSSSLWGSYSPGDGSTNFRVPDYRGYFARGWDNGRGIDTARAIGTSQASANLSHTHTANVTDGGHVHGMENDAGFAGTSANSVAGSNTGTTTNTTNTNSAVTGITVANVATGGTEARPVNLAATKIIKT